MEIEAAATSGHLGRDGGGISEAHPEDAAFEVAAVAVDEFGGELGFADPTEAGDTGDLHLSDRRGLMGLELAGQRPEIILSADEERIEQALCARSADLFAETGLYVPCAVLDATTRTTEPYPSCS
jgi:hypothetical protein